MNLTFFPNFYIKFFIASILFIVGISNGYAIRSIDSIVQVTDPVTNQQTQGSIILIAQTTPEEKPDEEEEEPDCD